MTLVSKKDKPNHGFVDTFNFFMIEGIELIGKYELPYISKYDGPIPSKIINFKRNPYNPSEYFVHHYFYDYLFDGRNGVWYGCQKDGRSVTSLLNKYKKYQGVISTDFSVYVDLPFSAQIWNIYRDRVTCAWLRKMGINTIFNIRWGDYRTYDLVFYGIEKKSVLAVGSHGLIKHPENRKMFMDGFEEMVKRLIPSKLIIYGTVLETMKTVCNKYSVEIIHFDSEQTEARKAVSI